MKRELSYFIFLVLFTIVYSCDDTSVTVEPDNLLPSKNILFSPDSLIIDNDTAAGLVSFYGFDFKKYKPVSIEIDSQKFDYKIVNDSLINVDVKGVPVGYYDITFYFSFGKYVLDKKLKILYNPDPLPSERTIYFSPDTLFIDMKNSFNTIYLFGVNFYKHNIDSVMIGSLKCQIGYKEINKLPIYVNIMGNGNYPVYIFYKGKKIQLKQELVIVNKIIDFDILKFNFISVDFHEIPVLYIDYNLIEYKKDLNFNFTMNNTESPNNFYSKWNVNVYENHITNPVKSIDITIEFDTLYRTYLRSKYYPPYYTDSYNITFYNIPFKINRFENDKIEMAIELDGISINNYQPLTTYNFSSWGGSQKNNDWSYGNSISKVDSISGKKINFYPATDSSKIIIYLRNFY
jgi:hypothetical protein